MFFLKFCFYGLFSIIFLTSCASDLLYENRNYIKSSNNASNVKTILFLKGNYDTYGDVINSDVPYFIQDRYYKIFNRYGFSKFEPSKKSKYPDYVAVINGICQKHRGIKTTPIYDKVGINSIDTIYSSNTYGNLYVNSYPSRFQTTYSGYYSGVTNGMAHSTVNYDYGVVGYSHRPYTYFTKNITFTLVSFNEHTKKPSSDIIYQSKLSMNVEDNMDCSLIDDAEMLSISDDKFIDKLSSSHVSCYYDISKKVSVCNPDNGFLSNLWGKIFHSNLYSE